MASSLGVCATSLAATPSSAPASSSPSQLKQPTAASSGGGKRQSASPIDPAKVQEAARRFERALQLFDSGDNAGALAEFKRIYDMVPQPVILYNIGLVFAAMSRPVQSADALERAIASGSLTPEQLERAKKTLADQQARIGHLTVTCKPEPARIDIDGVEVAEAPLSAPIRISEGSHIVGAVAEGYAPARKEVLIAGNAEASVDFELTPTASKQLANISVRSQVTAADVIVDGKSVGKTPLPTSITVAPGRHVIEVRRAGYAPTKREVELGPGGVSELSFNLTIDGPALQTEGALLALDPSASPSELTVDGERYGQYNAPLRLPMGPHHIIVTSPGFLPFERNIDLKANESNVVRAVLEPTAETRRNYKSNAMMHRTWGFISIAAGAVIAGGSTALVFVEGSRKSDAQAQLDDLIARNLDGNIPPCDKRLGYAAEPPNDDGATCASMMNAAADKIDSAKRGQTIGYVGIGVGAAVAVTGVVLLLTGGPPDKYEDPKRYAADRRSKLRFSMIPGPGQVGSGIQLSF